MTEQYREVPKNEPGKELNKSPAVLQYEQDLKIAQTLKAQYPEIIEKIEIKNPEQIMILGKNIDNVVDQLKGVYTGENATAILDNFKGFMIDPMILDTFGKKYNTGEERVKRQEWKKEIVSKTEHELANPTFSFLERDKIRSRRIFGNTQLFQFFPDIPGESPDSGNWKELKNKFALLFEETQPKGEINGVTDNGYYDYTQEQRIATVRKVETYILEALEILARNNLA